MRPQAVNVPLLPTEGAKEGLPVVVGESVLLPHLRPAFLRSRCRCFQRCHRGGERLAFLGRWPTFQRPCAETSRCRSRSSKTRTVHRGALLGRFFGVRHPERIACCWWMREGGGRGQIRGAKAGGSIDRSIGRSRSKSHARISDTLPPMYSCILNPDNFEVAGINQSPSVSLGLVLSLLPAERLVAHVLVRRGGWASSSTRFARG